MAESNSVKVQFYDAHNMKTELVARTGGGLTSTPSAVARRDLERYYYLLRLALAKIPFTTNEAMLLCDVMNGTINEPYSVSLLWASVSDALEEGYAEKWKVDGPALVARLKALTPFECMAVADAIERAWNSETYRIENMEERVRQVGLTNS